MEKGDIDHDSKNKGLMHSIHDHDHDIQVEMHADKVLHIFVILIIPLIVYKVSSFSSVQATKSIPRAQLTFRGDSLFI